MDYTSNVAAAAAAVASVATCYLYYSASSQQAQIDQLKFQLLAHQTRDIQTLNGKSSRKDWLDKHPKHQGWSSVLLSLQQKNMISMPPRPSCFGDWSENDLTNLALYNAAEQGSLNTAAAFLAEGYSPNHESELHPKFGTTPLMEACFHGHENIVRKYIEHNALLNIQSGYGWTALHYAGQANKLGCVELLIAAGANTELKNSKGKTARVRAVAQGKVEIAEALMM